MSPAGDAEVVALPDAFGLSPGRYEKLAGERAESGRGPAPLRDATSVLLVRDTGAGPEVFLLHRVSQMSFAGGMTVFPGGGVDARDQVGGATVDEDVLRRSAVRELFEETGVLLAGPSASALLDDTAHLAGTRAALTAGEIGLDAALDDAGLVPRDDLLAPWARWATPELMPIRYDLRFYLAEVPPGQEPDGATTEAAEAGWATPERALAAWTARERSLMPPTWAILAELAGFDDLASLRAASDTRRLDLVVPEPLVSEEHIGLGVPRWALPGSEVPR